MKTKTISIPIRGVQEIKTTWMPTCFVCKEAWLYWSYTGGTSPRRDTSYNFRIDARTQVEARMIKAIFRYGSWDSYLDTKVIVNACPAHLVKLQRLHKTLKATGSIDPDMVLADKWSAPKGEV